MPSGNLVGIVILLTAERVVKNVSINEGLTGFSIMLYCLIPFLSAFRVIKYFDIKKLNLLVLKHTVIYRLKGLNRPVHST